jgi:hypothetical protein
MLRIGTKVKLSPISLIRSDGFLTYLYTVADYKGLLHDLQMIQEAYQEGRHGNMPNFVAGTQDLARHLQVPLLFFSFLFFFPSSSFLHL